MNRPIRGVFVSAGVMSAPSPALTPSAAGSARIGAQGGAGHCTWYGLRLVEDFDDGLPVARLKSYAEAVARGAI